MSSSISSLLHECLEWYPAYNRGTLLFFLHKTLPRFKGRERLLNLLALCHKRRRLELINGRGIRVTINPLEHIGYALCAKNSFEPLSLNLAVRLMAGGGVFLDAGANFGLYSLSLAGIPGVRCLAVDALPQAVALLHEHRLLNPQASIEIFAVALSSSQGLVKFSGPHVGNFGTGRLNVAAESDALWVHATTLQSVINTAGLPNLNLMKMDVEGHEFEALLGMDFEVSCAPPHLILEQESAFNDAEAMQKIWALLKGKGYAPFDVLGNSLAMHDQPLENNVWWTRERHSLPSC